MIKTYTILLMMFSFFWGNTQHHKQPNIIFILADDLGYGELGSYGQKVIQTPNLDLLAAQGKRFTNFYAGGPVCGPSRACLLTGFHQGHGYIKNNPGGNPVKETLRPRDITFPEKLKEAGYYNACIGKWGLGAKESTGYPLEKGFDYFVGYDTHVAAHNYYPEKLCKNEGWMPLENGTYSHHVFTEEALAFLKKDHQSPFFLYLAYTIPHGPYNPPSMGSYADKDWPDKAKKYAAMITLMDTDIGRIMNMLQTQGLDENTLVIFTSDNGAEIQVGKNLMEDWYKLFNNNGGLRSGKRSVFDGGIHVPFIARWPNKINPGVIDEVLAFQDIMPTMMELAGNKDKIKTDGRSIVPLLFDQGKFKPHDKLYWEFIRQSKIKRGSQQAVLDVKSGYKAVRFGSEQAVKLYNIYRDPSESNRIYNKKRKIKALTHYLDTVRTKSPLWPMEENGWWETTPWEPKD